MIPVPHFTSILITQSLFLPLFRLVIPHYGLPDYIRYHESDAKKEIRVEFRYNPVFHDYILPMLRVFLLVHMDSCIFLHRLIP